MYPFRELPLAPALFWSGVGGAGLLWISLAYPEPADVGLFLLEEVIVSGVLAVAGVWWMDSRTAPLFAGRDDAWESRIVFLAAGLICLGLLAGGLVRSFNWYAAGPPTPGEYQVLEKRTIGDPGRKTAPAASPYRLRIKDMDGTEMEIGLSADLYRALAVGDRVRITTRAGRLFGAYVLTIRPQKTGL
jgi:hypothetical protein